MTFNPYFKTSESNYEGAKFSTWFVKFTSDTIDYNKSFTGSSTVPNTSTSVRIPFSSIETLKDPFGDGISINSSDSRQLLLPTGKYWLDWRAGLYSGDSAYNHYYYFNVDIGGYVESLNALRWVARGRASYLEEQVRGFHARNAMGYYESTGSSCYITCLHCRAWSSWLPGGTPQINKNGSSDFSTSTNFPYGESRLLVMRLE